MGDAQACGAHSLGFRHEIEGVGIPVAVGLLYIGGQVVKRITEAQLDPKPEKLFFVTDKVVLVSRPDKLLDVVGEGGIIKLMDISQIDNLFNQGKLLFGERSVITNNGCDLLHRNTDGFDKIGLCHATGFHHGVFDDQSDGKDEKERRIKASGLSAEGKQKKRYKRQKGVPAVGAEEAYHNA